MQETFSIFWWISVIEIPVIATMFFIIRNNRFLLDKKIDQLQTNTENNSKQILKETETFKLYSAREYASFSHLKDVENRLTDHLLRIEEKLEKSINITR